MQRCTRWARRRRLLLLLRSLALRVIILFYFILSYFLAAPKKGRYQTLGSGPTARTWEHGGAARNPRFLFFLFLLFFPFFSFLPPLNTVHACMYVHVLYYSSDNILPVGLCQPNKEGRARSISLMLHIGGISFFLSMAVQGSPCSLMPAF